MCLKSAVSRSYGDSEIIVVDRFSEDGTVEIAEN
ncbi:glycosyltransferase [Geoglobus acetivorans]